MKKKIEKKHENIEKKLTENNFILWHGLLD